MKKFLYFVVFVVIICAALPWLDGFYFKSQFINFVNALNQDNRIKISIIEYHEGWLHSYVRISAKANVPAPANEPVPEIIAEETITHGPIVYGKKQSLALAIALIESKMHLSDIMKQLMLGPTSVPGDIEVSTIATFNGHWKSHAHIPTISIQSPEGGNVTWKGLDGYSDLLLHNQHIDSVESQFTFGQLSASMPTPVNLELNVQPITLSYKGNLHPIGLWEGNFQISAPDLSFKNMNDKNLHINHFQLTTNTNITSNTFFNATENITIQALELPENDFTPISSAKLNVSITEFSAKGIIDLAHFLKNINSDNLPNDDFHNQLIIYISKIVTPSSKLSSDVSFNTPLGHLILSANAEKFAPNATTSDIDIMESGIIKVNIRIAVPLAKKIAVSYSQMLATHLLNQPGATINPVSTNQARIEQFNEKIAELMKQGKLSLSSSMQIMTLRNQDQTPEQFNQDLAKLSINPTIMAQIIALNTQLLEEQKTTQTNPATVPTPQINDLIDTWIKQGYLLQDNNDYTAIITIEKGVVTLNGKVISS